MRGTCHQGFGTLAGFIGAVGIMSVALAAEGFDCVVQDGHTQCYACSDCSIQGGDVVCGTVEAAASCLGTEQARCSVTVGTNGTTYSATCTNRASIWAPLPE